MTITPTENNVVLLVLYEQEFNTLLTIIEKFEPGKENTFPDQVDRFFKEKFEEQNKNSMNKEEAEQIEIYFFSLTEKERENILRDYFATLRSNLHTGSERFRKCAFAFNVLRSAIQHQQSKL